jgi:hypothetical protein
MNELPISNIFFVALLYGKSPPSMLQLGSSQRITSSMHLGSKVSADDKSDLSMKVKSALFIATQM